MGGPLLDPPDFFAVATDENSLAPNLDPHPGDRALAKQLDEVANRPDVDALKIAVDEDQGDVSAQGFVIVSSSPIEEFEDVQRNLRADSIREADLNTRKKLGALATGKKVYEISWD